MNAVIVYEGVLSNGIKYHIHQSSGFSNKCDIAINIEGEFVSVLTVVPKRSGNIDVIPMMIGRQMISVNKEKEIENTNTSVENIQTEDLPNENPQIKNTTPEPVTDLLSDVISNKEVISFTNQTPLEE
jgi:hypothetical protein